MISIFKSKKDLQNEWKIKTVNYAKEVNSFIEKGMLNGWDKAGPEPSDNNREKLVPYLLEEIQKANRKVDLGDLRENWPLAHSPLIPVLEKKGQSIPDVAILDDGRIVARIGASYEKGYVVEIRDMTISVVEGVEYFGKSPDKRYFACARPEGISVTEGWLGEEVAFCPYPTGLEGAPTGFAVKAFESPPQPTRLVPFPDGSKVLFVSQDGIFVLSPDKAVRLLPTAEEMREHFTWLQQEYPKDDLQMSLDMEHGTVSPHGDLIAVGSQDSAHLVFNDQYQLVAEVGTQSEYPHNAIFSSDGEMIAFNSCHFYNGVTVGVPVKLLPGLKTESYEKNELTPVLEVGSRVYAGTYRKNEFIIGDAGGYIRAFGKDGKQHWYHFIGSSIGDIDVSTDGTTLVCTTYAGFISILKLDQGASADYEIGNGGHTEVRRWLFWKGEEQPWAW